MKPERPGWYPDPHNSGTERWWNGIGWSEGDVRPAGGTPEPQAQLAPPPAPAPAQPTETAEQAAVAFGGTTGPPGGPSAPAAPTPSPYGAAVQQAGPGGIPRPPMAWPQWLAILGIVMGVAALFMGGTLGIPAIALGVVTRKQGAKVLGPIASGAGALGFIGSTFVRALLQLHGGQP